MSDESTPKVPKRQRRRRSSTKRNQSSNYRSNKSTLQLELEHAIQVPGGVRRTLDLVRSASNTSIEQLAEDWSPLAGVILLVGSTYTRRVGSRIPRDLIPTLLSLVELCHDRGISINAGSITACHFHRPLVLASYYGFVVVMGKLLDLGATPDLADGEGRTALHAALQNPAGQRSVLRDCDREVAQLLVQRHCITTSLQTWKQQQQQGSLIYVNSEAVYGSALLAAIRNKNIEVVDFLVGQGAVVTDRDFLALLQKRNGQQQLLTVVSKILALQKQKGGNQGSTASTTRREEEAMSNDKRSLHCWSSEIDWSFPPTWKVAIALIFHCGLPSDVFADFVLPFCGRDWFVTEEQRHGPLPARLGSFRGDQQRNLGARSVGWKS